MVFPATWISCCDTAAPSFAPAETVRHSAATVETKTAGNVLRSCFIAGLRWSQMALRFGNARVAHPTVTDHRLAARQERERHFLPPAHDSHGHRRIVFEARIACIGSACDGIAFPQSRLFGGGPGLQILD